MIHLKLCKINKFKNKIIEIKASFLKKYKLNNRLKIRKIYYKLKILN